MKCPFSENQVVETISVENETDEERVSGRQTSVIISHFNDCLQEGCAAWQKGYCVRR